MFYRSGYCAWRGVHNPTTLLADTCRKFNLDAPEYLEYSVRICQKEFITLDFTRKYTITYLPNSNKQHSHEIISDRANYSNNNKEFIILYLIL